jgi:hypothetical protein
MWNKDLRNLRRRATWEACSSNLECWEPSEHSLLDTGKPTSFNTDICAAHSYFAYKVAQFYLRLVWKKLLTRGNRSEYNFSKRQRTSISTNTWNIQQVLTLTTWTFVTYVMWLRWLHTAEVNPQYKNTWYILKISLCSLYWSLTGSRSSTPVCVCVCR